MKISNGSWPLTGVLFVISLFCVAIISFISTYFTDPKIDGRLSIFIFLSHPENVRTILSSVSQIQAAIFGIFFSLYFIICQIQIQNKAASPRLARKWSLSREIVFIIFVYIFSISFDLLLIRLIESRKDLMIDVFWAIVLFIFSLLVLLVYMRSNLLDLFKRSLVEEILGGSARQDLEEAELKGLKLNNVDLHGKRLIRSELNSSDLRASNLSGADLSEARLSNVDASNAEMNEAIFWRADLARATLNNSKLFKCDICEANLKGLTAKRANLCEARLNWSDLSDSRLIEADLRRANMFFTKLVRADLSRANMSDANLINVELTGAILDDADLCGAFISVSGSRLPGKSKLQYNELDLISLLKSKNLWAAIIYPEDLSIALNKEAIALLNSANVDDDFKNRLQTYLELYR